LAQVIWKCVNCGSQIERNLMRSPIVCRYCGAELLLSRDRSSFRLCSESTCSKCGAINEKSSWFCLACNAVLTNDIEMLREQKKKVLLEQERVLKLYVPPSLRGKFSVGEFMYYILRPNMGKDDFYAVTDKKIVLYRAKDTSFSPFSEGVLMRDIYEEFPLSEVVSVGPIHVGREGLDIDLFVGTVQGVLGLFAAFPLFAQKVIVSFEIKTLQRTLIFDSYSNQPSDPLLMYTFYTWLDTAILNHNMHMKDVRAIIMNLPV